jgi:dTDP-4-amino-4,6-dideoxygalactose transaminase
MKKNIFLQVHYIPIHLQPYYKKRYNIKKNELINAENFYAKEISLPIYPSLSIESAKFVAKSIININ